ncbi:hypothetical protein EI94DRAFT_78159 [Lactarius quietus]|nr:hypothetical protein EI94DRAFT_78159 [Lactarius quietus]
MIIKAWRGESGPSLTLTTYGTSAPVAIDILPFFPLSLAATLSHHVPNLPGLSSHAHQLAKRGSTKHDGAFVAGAVLMPILVILSGIFAGLTLGYMSWTRRNSTYLA